jgi:NhaA family Na+:H+ antiporter
MKAPPSRADEMDDNRTRLPSQPVASFTKPFMRFLRIEAVAGVTLLLSTLVAVGLANTGWSEQFFELWEVPVGFRIGGFEFSRSLKHWINDGLMTIFFFVIALELKREAALGELRQLRLAALPAAAALGGMVVPAAVFLLLIGDGPGANGWGTVMSTDTAFLVGCLAVLGQRVPQALRLFLLSLAIFDDIGAILVVAVGYGGSLQWTALAWAVTGLAAVAGIARLGVRSIPIYFALGSCVWLALDASGIHPTLAGVILGLMTPARSWVSDRRLHAILDRVIAYPPGDHWGADTGAGHDLRQAGVAAREAISPIERLEFVLHPWVAFTIMPLFALANAGVSMAEASFDASLTVGIFVAFVLGKPAGIILFSILAVKFRAAMLPASLTWRVLAAGSLLTGIGFTMALFIAELAFDSALLGSVKLGIMGASLLAATAGVLALVWLTQAPPR